MKRQALVASIATAGLVGTVLVGGVTFAQTNADKTNPAQEMAGAIASKFNLKQEDVQKVIEEQHQKKHEQRLNTLVSEGKITAEQKDKIIQKQQEMKPKFEQARSIEDDTARKAALDALRTEMQTWAKDNGIDMRYVGPGGHKGPGGHHGPGRHQEMKGGDRAQAEQ